MIKKLLLAFTAFLIFPTYSFAHDVSVKDAALSEPFHSDTFIKNWVGLAIADTMSFDFHNHKTHFKSAQVYFTDEGWSSYSRALKKSRLVEMVVKNQQIVSASLRQTPIIDKTQTLDEHHVWEVVVPIIITYQAGARQRTDKLDVTCFIARSDEPQNKDGIGITQLIAVPSR